MESFFAFEDSITYCIFVTCMVVQHSWLEILVSWFGTIPTVHLVYFSMIFGRINIHLLNHSRVFIHNFLQDTRFGCWSTLLYVNWIIDRFFCHFLEQFCEYISSLVSLWTSKGWSFDLAENRWFFCIFTWYIRLPNIVRIWNVLALQLIHFSSRFALINFGFTSSSFVA